MSWADVVAIAIPFVALISIFYLAYKSGNT